jgi:CheY-like chemotaxis protein
VDDEEVIIEIGREFLNSLGYKVLEAREGETALQIYSKYANDIGIVLLDMMMPGMKGDEVFRELKKINPNVKVVIISGFADKKIIQEMLRKGCCGYIRKPFMLDELSRVLNETLRKITSVIH